MTAPAYAKTDPQIDGPHRIEGGFTRKQIDDLDNMARQLDTRWRIPGTGIRFGLDAVLGLLPGVGDAASGLMAAFIVYRAHRMGAPLHLTVRMVANVVFDTVVGSIPVLGTVFDVFYKASQRNIAMLRKHMEKNLHPDEV